MSDDQIFTGIDFPDFGGSFGQREPFQGGASEDLARLTDRLGSAPQGDPGAHILLRRTRYTRKGVLKRPMRFQMSPLNEFGWDVTHSHTDYDTISRGQFSRQGGRQLRTINLSTMAMDWSAPYAVVQQGQGEEWWNNEDFYGSAGGPWHIAHRLDWLTSQGTPMMLVVKNPQLYKRPDVKMLVTLRSVSIREKAGEPDSRYFDLSFVEWRPVRIATKQYGRDEKHDLPATVAIGADGRAIEVFVDGTHTTRNKAKAKKENLPEQHVIGGGKRLTTLRILSKHYYGTTKKWRLIKMRNGRKMRGFDGDTPLLELYTRSEQVEVANKRRRKKRLVIPEANWRPAGNSGGMALDSDRPQPNLGPNGGAQ